MNNFYKYLPVTSVEEDWGLYVTSVGYTRINPKAVYPPSAGHPTSHAFTWDKGRILDGYYLVFIPQGKGVFESAKTRPSAVTAGTCFFLFPNIWHRYKPDPLSGWEEFWVGFKGEMADRIMGRHFFTSDVPFVHATVNDALLVSFERLITTVRDARPGYHQVISGITLEILGRMYGVSMHKEVSENPTQQLIARAMFLMRESLEKQVDMQQLARELPMGYSRFRASFKKLTGLSPHEYLLSLRLKKARTLLASTTLSVYEIAFQTGFESAYYFSRYFKKKNGVSPRQFRIEAREDTGGVSGALPENLSE